MSFIEDLEETVLRSLRDRYKRFAGIESRDYKSHDLVNMDGESASSKISQAILSQTPFLLSRFGSEEIKWYVDYKLLSRPYLLRAASYVTCETEYWKSDNRVVDNMTFKPKSLEMTEFFIGKMDDAIPNIDLLGSWLKLEKSRFIKLGEDCKYTHLIDIEPYYHAKPWSAALSEKKVLVIHPMEDSIQRQYKNREKLFSDKSVLPDFELITVKAKYFDEPGYDSWRKIFEYYMTITRDIDFDVAILGCGSWGMPLASEIKNMGKVALHLGGATQLLFGIAGDRWASQYKGFREKFINEYWVKPTANETPIWSKNYDGNSYW